MDLLVVHPVDLLVVHPVDLLVVHLVDLLVVHPVDLLVVHPVDLLVVHPVDLLVGFVVVPLDVSLLEVLPLLQHVDSFQRFMWGVRSCPGVCLLPVHTDFVLVDFGLHLL